MSFRISKKAGALKDRVRLKLGYLSNIEAAGRKFCIQIVDISHVGWPQTWKAWKTQGI